MAEWVTMGIFTILVMVGMYWMLKTKEALNNRIKKLEEKKNE